MQSLVAAAASRAETAETICHLTEFGPSLGAAQSLAKLASPARGRAMGKRKLEEYPKRVCRGRNGRS